MIRILLKEEQDTTTLAVCAHDVGEYVRHYPVVSWQVYKSLTSELSVQYVRNYLVISWLKSMLDSPPWTLTISELCEE